MKKALGLWLILFSIIIGGIFFFFLDKNKIDESGAAVKNTASVTEAAVKKTSIKTDDFYPHIGKIDESLKGQTIITTGYVSKMSEGKNTIFFTLADSKDNNKIKCVLFNKTNTDLPARKKLLETSLKNAADKPIYLEGEVDIYKGSLEIKVWKVAETREQL